MMKTKHFIFVCILWLAGCGQGAFQEQEGHGEHHDASEHPHVEGMMFHNITVTPTLPGIKHTAAYMAIMSNLEHDITLIKVESKVANRAEIHEHAMIDGEMKMRKIDTLPIPTRATTLFRPGGYHLMLMDLKEEIEEGDSVQITLHFDTGEEEVITAKAMAPLAAGEHQHPGTSDYE